MKTTFHYKISLFLVLCASALVGCDTVDSSSSETLAPTVLPSEAFAMDMTLFSSQAGKNTHESSHYVAAVWRVSVATLITGTVLYYPAVLTEALQEVEPVVQDNEYIWAAETMIKGRVHGAELRAKLNGGSIDWTMRVSGIEDETGVYLEDFILYEASTGVVSSNGTFEVFYPKDETSIKVMQGAYRVNHEETHTLSFEIPEPVEDLGGSMVTYGYDRLNVSIDITGPDGGHHFVEWNDETGAGSLTADDYNNGEKACWDDTQQNVACEGV